MRINGFATPTQTKIALARWAEDRFGVVSQSTLELLALSAYQDLQTFILEHTFLGLRRSIVRDNPGIEHGIGTTGNALQLALTPLRSGQYICPACIRQDLRESGIPHYRRTHQLLGIYWCPWHGNPLSWAHNSVSTAFLESPTRAKGEPLQGNERLWIEKLRSDEAISRFLIVQEQLLRQAAPLSAYGLCRAMLRLAEELGLHHGGGARNGLYVSDLLRETYDSKWLHLLLPELTKAPKDSYVPTIDVLTRGRRANIKIAVYIAALAAVFNDVEAALRFLREAGAPERDGNELPAPIQLSVSRLRDHYINAEGNVADAATDTGLNPDQMRRRLSLVGLPPIIPNSSLDDFARFVQAFVNEKRSIGSALEASGLSQFSAEKFIRAALRGTEDALSQILRRQIAERKHKLATINPRLRKHPS